MCISDRCNDDNDVWKTADFLYEYIYQYNVKNDVKNSPKENDKIIKFGTFVSFCM